MLLDRKAFAGVTPSTYAHRVHNRQAPRRVSQRVYDGAPEVYTTPKKSDDLEILWMRKAPKRVDWLYARYDLTGVAWFGRFTAYGVSEYAQVFYSRYVEESDKAVYAILVARKRAQLVRSYFRRHKVHPLHAH